MADTQLTVHVVKIFNATPAAVYAAWTQAQHIKQWFGPSNDYSIPEVTMDVSPGGKYRIKMQSTDGTAMTVIGTFKEVVPNKKLIYTWQWEASPKETLVTVTFEPIGDGKTRLGVTHQSFLDEQDKQNHEDGWYGCLGRLEALLEIKST